MVGGGVGEGAEAGRPHKPVLIKLICQPVIALDKPV